MKRNQLFKSKSGAFPPGDCNKILYNYNITVLDDG